MKFKHGRYRPNQYLICDPYGFYHVRIALPDYMQSLFSGRKTLVRTLSTNELKIARMKRDQIADEFHRLRDAILPDRPDSVADVIELLRSKAKYAKAATKVQVINKCPALRGMLDIYLLQNSNKKKVTTLSKTKKAVEVFLDHLRKRDIALNEVNRTTVTAWIDVLQKKRSQQTIANYISALAQIWDLASSRYEDAPERSQSPWRGHKLDVAESRASYEVFTPTELAKVFSALEGDEEMQNVTLIGMYSGMRLNEICSLRVENIREIEGVLCFEVTEGKTKSASRIIPVHSMIMDMLKELVQKPHNGFLFYRASIIDRADGKRSTWHTQRFTRAKRKALGEQGTERKVFHSLRHGVAQIFDRGGVGTGKLKPVPEDRIALLLGHERGSTESFKTYSKNAASPVELRQYIELLRYPEIEKGA